MLKALNFFRPAPHIPRLPKEQIDPAYKKARIQVFVGILVGYVCFYLVRNNFALAVPHLLQEGFTKTQLGLIPSAMALAYGFSKFFMAIVSDRSNPRYFMATGLILAAIISFFMGTNVVLGSLSLMIGLMFCSGWVQAMGWPASARVMVHWFSESERGAKMSIWACAQNIGGGLVALIAFIGMQYLDFSWQNSIFSFPAIVALAAAVLVLFFVKDTPQSEGLPPIEEYHHEKVSCDGTACQPDAEREKELTAKEILFKYVLVNKYLWYLALANIFVYFIRFGIGSWIPTYLTEVKGLTPAASKLALFWYEYAAIPGIILCGWLSDKFFASRRAPMCVIYMAVVSAALLLYWFVPMGETLLCNVALIGIGFFIYGPVVLIGISAVDIAPKKAAGTAAGLTGLLGYVVGTMGANLGAGMVVDNYGWRAAFIMLFAACILAIFFLALNWNAGKVVKQQG